MSKEFIKNILKKLLRIHVEKAVEEAENYLRGRKLGQYKKNYVVNLIFSKIKFPSFLEKFEQSLKELISTFIDELIEKAVKELKEKLENGKGTTALQ